MGQPEAEAGKEPTTYPQAISPGYFQTMKFPLLQGRDSDANDRTAGQPVVIIDAGLAQHYFPNENPIGKQIIELPGGSREMRRDTAWTIVGVVQNSRHNRPQNPAAPYQAYFPDHQVHGLFREFLLLRTAGDPSPLIPEIEKLVASVDPEVPATDIKTFDDLIGGKICNGTPRRASECRVLYGRLIPIRGRSVRCISLLCQSTSKRNRRPDRVRSNIHKHYQPGRLEGNQIGRRRDSNRTGANLRGNAFYREHLIWRIRL